MMKYLFIKFLCLSLSACLISVSALAQPKPKATPAKPPVKKTAKTTEIVAQPTPQLSENDVFDKAKNAALPSDRVNALADFVGKYPDSKLKTRALELIVSARAQDGDGKIVAGDIDGGLTLFDLAVKEAPVPVSDELFDQVLSLMPENLFERQQPDAAKKISAAIEEKIGNNVDQLLDLAKAQLQINNYDDAQRMAKKVIELDPTQVGAYEVIGSTAIATLQLSDAEGAYEKAAAASNASVYTRLYLANMKRALGKPAEALAIYTQILAKDPQNTLAQTGKVMSLFDAGKRTDAEHALQEAVAANPKNFNLLTGAAYWYAANNDGDMAIEYAQRSIAIEPRFVWSYVALMRGLVLKKKPADAERAMMQGAQYGNFATLNYELASSKASVGLYDEAAADLKKSFTLKDGNISAVLAGSVPQSAATFIDLLAPERRASIYEFSPADSPENSKVLKDLLAFDLKMAGADPNDDELSAAADDFAGGADKMQIFRRIYAASRLIQKRKLPAKVLELTQSIVVGIDSAADVPGAATAVLAEEITGPRQDAIRQGTAIVVPDIQRPVLLSVLRGRAEEFQGGALYQQQKNDEAIVHLRRAITVLPAGSSWWRSSLWRLGIALDTSGKSDEAFAAYSKSYMTGAPDVVKSATLKGMCQRLFNTQDGCEEKIAAAAKDDPRVNKPSNSLLKTAPTPALTPQPAADKTGDAAPVENIVDKQPPAEIKSEPKTEPAAEAKPEIKPVEKPAAKTGDKKSDNTEQKGPDALPTDRDAGTNDPVLKESDLEPLKKEDAKTGKPAEEPKKETDPAAETAAPLRTDDKLKTVDEAEKKIEQQPAGETRKRIASGKPPADGAPGVIYANQNARVTVGSGTGGCDLFVNGQKLSLIGNGGWSSVSIDLHGDGKLDDIKITNENAGDLAVELQPGIGRDIGRVVYIVRSISQKKGEYKLYVESPCGEKKEISVTVR
jgi:tetratricopeptide (TPR) repeat protein